MHYIASNNTISNFKRLLVHPEEPDFSIKTVIIIRGWREGRRSPDYLSRPGKAFNKRIAL